MAAIKVEETNPETNISVESFDNICRLCLEDIKKEISVFNINDYLVEELVIKDILIRYTSIRVSCNFC